MDPKNTNTHEAKVFEILEHWKPVDVPEYFETRILSRMDFRPSKPMKWGWAALAAIFLINGLVATQHIRQAKAKTKGAYGEYLEAAENPYKYYPRQS